MLRMNTISGWRVLGMVLCSVLLLPLPMVLGGPFGIALAAASAGFRLPMTFLFTLPAFVVWRRKIAASPGQAYLIGGAAEGAYWAFLFLIGTAIANPASGWQLFTVPWLIPTGFVLGGLWALWFRVIMFPLAAPTAKQIVAA